MVEQPPRDDEKKQPDKPLNVRIEGTVYLSGKAIAENRAEKTDHGQPNAQDATPWLRWVGRLIGNVLTSSSFWTAVATIVIAAFTVELYRVSNEQGQTMQTQLELSERPWIKINHRIVKPLTFDVPGWKGPIATMTIQNTLENVGNTVALDVVSWEDIIPMDSPFSYETATRRQNEWCGANQHRDLRSGITGYVLFPHDPLVEESQIGPFMTAVLEAAAAANPGGEGLKGKVAFVLVGCVVYRAPFDPEGSRPRETRFMYTLGKLENGRVQPWVTPHGEHPELGLVVFPEGFTAN